MRYFTILLLLLLCVLTLTAQDEQTTTETLQAGNRVTGRLDAATPRAVYSLAGARGEVVRFTLQATSGDLDPVLTVFTREGEAIFQQDDAGGSRNVEATLTFSENATYFVVVARYGYSLGSTSGEYELIVERVGVLSEEGVTLQYGEPVFNTISNARPQLYYTFQARAGDIIDVEMVRASGMLDPKLLLVDSDRFLIAENDDFNEDTAVARISNVLIERTGTYIIVATRYGEAVGDTVGNFALLVDESRNSGLGNNRLAPAPLFFDQQVTGRITGDRAQQYYEFEAEQDQIITVTMERANAEGQLDAYLVLANAGFQPLIENDDGGSGKNARIANYRLPAAGRYVIIATRFNGREGETFGDYRLTLLDEGDAYDGVPDAIPRLLYGTIVPDSITEDDLESLYVFWGTAGERISIAMNRSTGNLDPVIELLDDERVRMLRDDSSGNGENARIETTLTYTGVHYIRATRYEGSAKNNATLGDFVIALDRET